MSHYMTALAMKQQGLKPATKIVLYWLADHHNGDTGDCFPSLNLLARECEMSRPTIVKHLNELEGGGLIARSKRQRDNGSQTSTAYILNLTPVKNFNSPCKKTEQPPVKKRDPLNLVNNNLVNEPSINIGHAFAEFWERYPRKVQKGYAEKAFFKALKIAPFDDIMFGLSQQIPSMEAKDKKYIPHASSWLNGKGWEDEIESASTNQTASQQRGNAQFDEARERALRIGAGGKKPDPIGF